MKTQMLRAHFAHLRRHRRTCLRATTLAATILGVPLNAHEPITTEAPTVELDEIIVQGRADNLIGDATSASEGRVGHQELESRPLLRRGELLEVIPGMVVTQHSGDGKANQYFLRGFNLDHGTDFSIQVDGLPVNMPTHGHGQGYADLNFLIPELIERVDFAKGPFYLEVGDFSGAGAAQFRLFNVLPKGVALGTVGEHGYARLLIADSPKAGPGTLLYAFEFTHYDGPWVHAQNANRYNAVLRYHWHHGDDQFTLTAMAYHGDWNSTDQIPQRAIDRGMNRFDSMNTTDGGASDRDSLSFDWLRDDGEILTGLNLYGIYYRMNLFSDFTYWLEDPARGDQFEQVDKRFILGGSLYRLWRSELASLPMENTLGFQFRDDIIPEVGLNSSEKRRVVGNVRRDRVNELSISIYGKNQVRWADWFRSELGLRGDLVHFDVNSSLKENSGTKTAAILNPKLSLIFGPWQNTEYYLNVGTGFHSNDARGVVIHRDPVTRERVGQAPALVRTQSAEIGVRTSVVPGLVSTLALWVLESDSELVFSGDSGGTEPAGATRRYGLEWSNFYKPLPWLALDGDLALTNARFRNPGKNGPHIPNSIATVASAGMTAEAPCGLYGTLRLRYFGPQPLVEDNSARGGNSMLLNARIGYRYKNYEVALDVLNLLDQRENDIAYYYPSRLRGEPGAGFDDYHVHPAEPRTFRLTATVRF